MRLLVCGSRDFENQQVVWNSISTIITSGAISNGEYDLKDWTIIEGGASGADALAAKYGGYMDVNVETYPADWNAHGKAAGPIRNQQMLDEGKPDKVLAFINKPLVESRGTKHMVEIAEKAGLPVIIVETRNM